MLRPLYLLIFNLLGWKIVGEFPRQLKKYIIAVAPHTSNWDFPLGVMARSILRREDAHFLGKHSLFKPPFGWFFRWLGGYPVDRSSSPRANLSLGTLERLDVLPRWSVGARTPGAFRLSYQTSRSSPMPTTAWVRSLSGSPPTPVSTAR